MGNSDSEAPANYGQCLVAYIKEASPSRIVARPALMVMSVQL